MKRVETESERKEPPPVVGGSHVRLGHGIFWRILAILILLFAGGFIVFATSIPRAETKLARDADAIVVFTGGASRIVDAVELLAAGRGQWLLISGVHPATTPAELTRTNPEFERLLACCIKLGHQATNTVGNAIETGRWVREHGFRSLIVVTSAWHMPRALIEVQRELPGVTLIPFPVVSERIREEPWWSSIQTMRLFLVEYVKYIASLVRVQLDQADTSAGQHPTKS